MINISFGYKQQAIIKFTWAHNAICAEVIEECGMP